MQKRPWLPQRVDNFSQGPFGVFHPWRRRRHKTLSFRRDPVSDFSGGGAWPSRPLRNQRIQDEDKQQTGLRRPHNTAELNFRKRNLRLLTGTIKQSVRI